MDIQAKKLLLIEGLINLQDESLLDKVEDLLRKARISAYEQDLKPMSITELQLRALKSEEDIKNNRVTNLDDVIKESENW